MSVSRSWSSSSAIRPCLGPPLAAPLTREGRKPAKLDQPRLVLMKRQTEAGQPRPEGQKHFLHIHLPLEAHDEVIRIAHGHYAAACVATAPLVGPEIEDVVQEYVGEERAGARPLRGTPVRFLLLAALQNAGPQPQLYEPQDARIGDPVRHHPQQPLVVDRVKRLLDRLPTTARIISTTIPIR
ncbi:hypothetical protein ACVWZZ_005926 [Bradyrhizobium sp. LM6.10]